MRIKRQPVVFHNVLSMTDRCGPGEWGTMELLLRSIAAQNGLYPTAPTFYRYAGGGAEGGLPEFTVHLPLGGPVQVGEGVPAEFLPEVAIGDALVYRVADAEDDGAVREAEELLGLCAAQEGLELERPFYYVCLDVYGEAMVDVVAPVKGGGGDA